MFRSNHERKKRGTVIVVMVIGFLVVMCVSHVMLNRTVRNVSRRDTSHKFTTDMFHDHLDLLPKFITFDYF